MASGIHAKFCLNRPGFTLDVDLRLPSSGVSVLFGASGCGKTTLLRLVAGLEKDSHGEMAIDDEFWQTEGKWVPPHRRALGMVFQQAHLFAHLSVRNNLEYGWRRLAPTERRDLASVVDLLGIGHLMDRKPAGLSGGEAQRVGIARALAVSPRLLLMDEPLSALDHSRKREILPYLEKLRDELGIPILYVTHSPDEVARLADHLVILDQGRVVAQGAFTQLQHRMDLPRWIGEEVGLVLEAVIGEVDERWGLARADFPGGGLWARDRGLPVGKRTRLKVLARDVSLSVLPPARSSIQNVLAGVVEALGEDEHPGLMLVRVELGGSALLARVSRRAIHEMAIAIGMQVWVQVKTVALAE